MAVDVHATLLGFHHAGTSKFAGIAPASAPRFIAAQIIGAAIGLALVLALHLDAAPR